MARLVVTLLLCLLVVSCRGEKQQARVIEVTQDGKLQITPVSPDATVLGRDGQPVINSGETSQSSTAATPNSAPETASADSRLVVPEGTPSPASATQNSEVTAPPASSVAAQAIPLAEYDLVLAAARQLKALLDLKVDNSPNSLRMEGLVVTNPNPRFGMVLSSLGEDSLYELLTNPTGNEEYRKLKEAWALTQNWLVRLDTLSTITEALRTETFLAFEKLERNTETYRDVAIPISIRMTNNPYLKDDKRIEMPKSFYAFIVIEKQKFTGFKLMDRKLNPVGRIHMPLVPSTQNISDYRMIISFKNDLIGKPIEQTTVMKLTEVKTLPKLASKIGGDKS